MADFQRAIPVILAHEGGDKFTETPGDKGKATKWGITIATLRLWRKGPTSTTDVRNLTREEAVRIYRARYWDVCRCDELHNQNVATKVFDLAVNCGYWNAVRMVQRAVVYVASDPAACKIDGIMGPVTISSINSVAPYEFIHSVCRLQRTHYEAIISNDPTQAKFRNGWLKRADWDGTEKT